MKLETAQTIASDDVTASELRDAIRDDAGRGEFIILRQSPEVYIQAWGERDGPFALEYRDGSADQHFHVDQDLSRDDVERAFGWYLAKHECWRTEFHWVKPEAKPWWKFW